MSGVVTPLGDGGTTTVSAGSVVGLDEAVDDRLDALLVAGPNIALVYDDTAGALTIDGTHTHVPGDVTGLNDYILDTVGGALIAGDNVTIDQDSVSGAITIAAAGIGWASAPASAGATGVAGQIAYDSGFLYVCVAANTWKRAALSTWP